MKPWQEVKERRAGIDAYEAWARDNLPIEDTPVPPANVTVILTPEDYRILTEYDPERERSANRRDLMWFIEEMQAIIREGRRD